jgi:hypothetical protein
MAARGRLRSLQYQIENSLALLRPLLPQPGLGGDISRAAYGTDVETELEKLVIQCHSPIIRTRVCLGSKLIFENESWLISWLHNHTPLALCNADLHLREIQMIVTPIKI